MALIDEVAARARNGFKGSDRLALVETDQMSFSLLMRALAFAGGASAIGMAVVPTEVLLVANALPSQIVIARLAWGTITLFLLCVLLRPRSLIRRPKEHVRLCGVGLLLGWATVELYTRALAIADILPVIVVLVAASAVTGMVLQFGWRFRIGHVFVLLSVLIAVSATVQNSSPGFGFSGIAFVYAVSAGIIYGALPVLCRTSGRRADIACVMLYLGYGTLWAILFLGISEPDTLHASLDVVLSVPGALAGVLCTGLGYALFQIGISPNQAGQRISSTWAGLLFGFEPISAIAAASFLLGQSVAATAMLYAIGFVLLVGLAGPVLATLSDPSRP